MSTKSRAVGLAPYLLSAIGSSLVAAFALQLWRAHLGIPLSYSGDAVPHSMHFEQITAGWFWNEPRLGAPFGQHFSDWPLPEVLHLVIGKFFTLFTDDWAVIVNLVFLIGFPLAALSACWVLRFWKVSRPLATVMAILYSVVPYHFVRGEHHLFLSGYYMVPFGIWLAMCILERVPLFSTKWTALRTVVITVLISMSAVYYAAFTLVFLLAATALVLLRDRNWRSLVTSVGVMAILLGTVVIDTAPTILHHREYGANVVAGDRQPSDTDYYGLKLAQMLMPADGHRIDQLDDLQRKYLNDFPIPSERGSSALGTLGAVGLLYLLALAVVRLAKRDEPTRESHLAALVLPAILVASVGGISTFIALVVSSQIRSWNRISIFIAFAALAAVAMVVDRIAKRFEKRWIVPAVSVVLLVGGVVDQTTQAWIPSYKDVDAAFLSDDAFYGRIEASLPSGAEVYQLPFIAFPEAPPMPGLATYDPLKAYLHTDTLRWSHGGIKGRPESDWQARLDKPDSMQFASQLVAAGFEGVLIDRNGFPDKGAEVESVLRRQVTTQPIVSDGGIKVFYDLRSIRIDPTYAETEKARLLFPVVPEPADEFYGSETDGSQQWIWAKGEDADLTLVDGTTKVENTHVAFSIGTATGEPSDVTITWPDKSIDRISVGADPVIVNKDLRLAVGDSKVKIDTDAAGLNGSADARDLHFRLFNLDVRPS